MTTELGYANSVGKDLVASGRFNIGEDVWGELYHEDV